MALLGLYFLLHLPCRVLPVSVFASVLLHSQNYFLNSGISFLCLVFTFMKNQITHQAGFKKQIQLFLFPEEQLSESMLQWEICFS